jgi:hypothetical protein
MQFGTRAPVYQTVHSHIVVNLSVNTQHSYDHISTTKKQRQICIITGTYLRPAKLAQWWPGREDYRSFPPSAKIKNKWIYTSNPAYVFIAFLN